MWKNIAILQLLLLIALCAFWAGTELRADEPLTRQFVTQNEEGNLLYVWIYDAGNKEWNATRLNFDTSSLTEIEIPLK